MYVLYEYTEQLDVHTELYTVYCIYYIVSIHVAFLEACQRYGFVYLGVEDQSALLAINGDIKRFRVLHVLDFDSTRKCMSVILQDYNCSHS